MILMNFKEIHNTRSWVFLRCLHIQFSLHLFKHQFCKVSCFHHNVQFFWPFCCYLADVPGEKSYSAFKILLVVAIPSSLISWIEAHFGHSMSLILAIVLSIEMSESWTAIKLFVWWLWKASIGTGTCDLISALQVAEYA